MDQETMKDKSDGGSTRDRGPRVGKEESGGLRWGKGGWTLDGYSKLVKEEEEKEEEECTNNYS